jgi:hypothetical protein
MAELKRIGPNCAEVTTGDRSILFSYDVPVGVRVKGFGWFTSDKYWSRTTAGHVKKWLDGIRPRTVSQAEIERMAADGNVEVSAC